MIVRKRVVVAWACPTCGTELHRHPNGYGYGRKSDRIVMKDAIRRHLRQVHCLSGRTLSIAAEEAVQRWA